MMGRQHLLFGISTATAFSLATFESGLPCFEVPIIFVTGAAIGSLAPDIDTPKSMLGRCFYPISFLLNKIIGHRTYTHDPILWIPIAIVLTIKYPILFGFFFGYLGHLFLDSLTADGIPFFYFINKKPFKPLSHFLRFKANSITAKWVTIAISVIVISIIGLLKNVNIIFVHNNGGL